MVPFQGKLGTKFFQLCDAKTGYCKNFSIYAGKDDKTVGAIGKTGKIVMDLVRDLYNTTHHLYSFPLIEGKGNPCCC